MVPTLQEFADLPWRNEGALITIQLLAGPKETGVIFMEDRNISIGQNPSN